MNDSLLGAVSSGMGARLCRTALAVLVSGLVAVVFAPEATAGGMDIVYPVRDRYETGETATLIGYTVRSTPDLTYHDRDTLDWSDTGPFHGYLRVDPRAVARDHDGDSGSWPHIHPTDIDLGEPTVAETGHGDQAASLAVRVSLRFPIPPGLSAGAYEVFFCNQPCTTTLGHIGGATVFVGVDPPRPIVREWPLDDPAIADLADDALVADYLSVGDTPVLTAAQIRAGDVPVATSPPPTTGSPPTTSNPRPGGAGAQGPGPGGGSDIGGAAPWLIALAVMVGLWCATWRISRAQAPERTPRPRVTDVSPPPGDLHDLPSDHAGPIRL